METELVYIQDTNQVTEGDTALGMNCPNCGATMKPSELLGHSGALASANCPYCGSQIVINDEVKNAQYVQEVELEKKRVDIEERRVKIEEDRAKRQEEFRKCLEEYQNRNRRFGGIDNEKDSTKRIK